MVFLALWGFWGVIFLLLGKRWKSNISNKVEKLEEELELIE